MPIIYSPQLVPTRNRAWTREQDNFLREWYGKWQVCPAVLTVTLGKCETHIIGRLKQLGIYRVKPSL
jgi:hypothetical protein